MNPLDDRRVFLSRVPSRRLPQDVPCVREKRKKRKRHLNIIRTKTKFQVESWETGVKRGEKYPWKESSCQVLEAPGLLLVLRRGG